MTLFDSPKLAVGFFIVVCLILAAFILVKVGESPDFLRRGYSYHFFLSDASGLVRGSQVRSLGVPVGIIDSITMDNGRVKVSVTLSGLKPKTSSLVRIRSFGILGDKFVDISSGNSSDAELSPGEEIAHMEESGSMDEVFSSVSELARSLKSVASEINSALKWTDGEPQNRLAKIIQNIEKVTADFADVSGQNKGSLRAVMKNIEDITSSIKLALDSGFPSGNKLSSILERIENTVKNIESVSQKVALGEGVVGRLLTDETLADRVDQTIEGINDFIGGASGLSTALDFNYVYLGNQNERRVQAGVYIQPGLDRYYYLGIVDHPYEITETEEITVTTNGSPSQIKTEKKKTNAFKLSLLFAKKFGNAAIQVGLIEGTAGLGLEYRFFADKLLLSLQNFDFQNLTSDLRLRYYLFHGFYLAAGYFDLWGKRQKSSAYGGIGLFLTNDDLRLLLNRLPF